MLAKESVFAYNPIDVVENIFGAKSFDLERRNSNEVVIEMQGKWKEMLIFFAWEENIKCLQISCFIDIEVNTTDKSKIFELLALANSDLWMGHFSYWSEQNMPVFKHSVILSEDKNMFAGKIEQMISIAVKECERMYPIFYAVLTKDADPNSIMSPTEVLM